MSFSQGPRQKSPPDYEVARSGSILAMHCTGNKYYTMMDGWHRLCKK